MQKFKKQTLTTYHNLKGKVTIKNSKGEEIELEDIQVTENKKVRNSNFYMLFAESLLKSKGTGIFEIDFLLWIFRDMSNYNVVNRSDCYLAKKLKVCRQTIGNFKAKLKNANVIKYKANVIMVNPSIIFKGSAYMQSECVYRYQEFDKVGEE